MSRRAGPPHSPSFSQKNKTAADTGRRTPGCSSTAPGARLRMRRLRLREWRERRRGKGGGGARGGHAHYTNMSTHVLESAAGVFLGAQSLGNSLSTLQKVMAEVALCPKVSKGRCVLGLYVGLE